MKMIPTHGKRPEGLKDSDTVWMQHRDDNTINLWRAGNLHWDNKTIAYCLAEPPEPYVPEPDYSKRVGEPISTAPHDKRVLVWTGQEWYVAHWVQHPVTGDEAWLIATWGDGEQTLVHPTHWMPLPDEAYKKYKELKS